MRDRRSVTAGATAGKTARLENCSMDTLAPAATYRPAVYTPANAAAPTITIAHRVALIVTAGFIQMPFHRLPSAACRLPV